jgi:hypothetical protein
MDDQGSGIHKRRDFLRLVAGGSLACAGCGLWGASASAQKSAAAKHKFTVDSKFTFEQVFQFGYQRTIELLRGLEAEIGREKLQAMVKAISEKSAEEGGRQMAKYGPRNDLAAFSRTLREPRPLLATRPDLDDRGGSTGRFRGEGRGVPVGGHLP